MPDKPTLTPNQRRGVETAGVSLLMSAAAGSGKTRVLAERCAYLVCDAPPPYRCDVNELLVVTFTEKAATEMRDRIGRALDARLHGQPDARLQRQRLLLVQAHVSTLHSFCAQLLRQHFHLVGLDPAFTVMDEHEAMLLRLDVGRAMLRERYAQDSDGSFQRLLDAYVEGDDERLLREIFRIHDLLGSLLDPGDWLERAEARIGEASNGELTHSELGKELVGLLKRRIAGMGLRCNSALALLQSFGGFQGYVQRVIEVRQICRHVYALLDREGIDAVKEMVDETRFEPLRPVSNQVPNKELAKLTVDAVLKEFKEGGWRTLLNFTAANWQDGLRKVTPHVGQLVSLVHRFHEQYRQVKDEARQLDFADLERYALNVLLADPANPTQLRPSAAARHYHHLFKHVLVDEYQDINEIQNAILFLASHECAISKDEGRRMKDEDIRPSAASSTSSFILHPSSLVPNLFCVGDVKQSIYRFRLADPEQFIRREQALRRAADTDAGSAAIPGGAGEVIDLKQNFRSRGPLLEAINAVFARLMTKASAEIDYDDTQRLVPGRAFGDAGGAAVFPWDPLESTCRHASLSIL